MCGRFTLAHPETAHDRFGFADFHDTRLTARFNIAPSQEVPAVVESHGARELRFMRWGYQPAWLSSQPKRPPPINARAEALLEGSLFRSGLQYGRCLLPADGFYEWQSVSGSGPKQPVYIRLKSAEQFAFAGLWTRDKTGRPTCAIVTTEPNALVAGFHNRMPVILDRADEGVWVDRSRTDALVALGCLRPYPQEEMEAVPVSRLVNSALSEGPELIEPVEADWPWQREDRP